MMNLRNVYIFLLLLVLSIPVIAQVSNPFDIKVRNDTKKEVVVRERTENVGSLITEQEEDKAVVSELEVAAGRESAIQESADPIVQEGGQIEQVSFIERKQAELMQANPFNVTHIPIKRSKSRIIAKKAEAEAPSQATLNPESETEVKPEAVIEKENAGTNRFIFWLLLLQLLLLTSLLGINREIIRKIYRSINNDNFAKLVSRDYNGGYNALFGILYVFFFLSLSIFAYLVLKRIYGINGFGSYMGILLSVIGIYLIRHIFQGISGAVFPFGKASAYYNFSIILFNSFLGVVLFPINVIVAYTSTNLSLIGIYIGLGAVLILYLLRFLRGSLHAYTYIRKYVFHFFLYLCTCEFAPVFILVKFLSKSFVH